ncbi:hypothetical protein L211DRAFT_402907 [Terfezia boudieri ATCC MYA-4762]|uniref:DUF7223 domain-containing protein n=1 Tax=Terfezia boudieri ATCC MYA-4762 TaxID=1051890 RepID=A0A3N4M434_9PEZI|nr:hypothetical protein L211DRAFT_402907 [Terfezia boudieri ATCC MYA-4762]
MPTTYLTLKTLVLAGLASLPSLAYGHKNAVRLFPQGPSHGTTLVPYLTPRSLIKRDQVRIKETVNSIDLPELGQSVELLYGEDLGEVPSTTDPFVTIIEFLPAPNRAILLLEEYIVRPWQGGNIIHAAKCEGSLPKLDRVILDMVKNEQRVQIFNHWLARVSKAEELVVVTSDIMRGCGNKERKAFLVNSITTEGTLTTLDVTPIEWSMISLKMSVEFGRLSTTSLTKRLDPGLLSNVLRRDATFSTTTTGKPGLTPKASNDDDDGVKTEGLINIQPDIKQRLRLFPLPNIMPTISTSLPFDIPFLPEEDGRNYEIKQDPGLTVTCVDCTLKGVMSYYGKLDADLTFTSGLKLDQAYIVIDVTEDLKATVNLEVATGEQPFQYSLQQSIFPALGSQTGIVLASFGVTGVIEIRPYFDYAIGGSIEVGAPKTNVTFGGELRVKKGATLRWDLVQETSSQSGWDVEVTTFPMKINKADKDNFTLGLNISSIPSILMSLEIGSALGEAPIQVGAKLAMILPRLYTKSTLVREVTAMCAPPGPNDFTYFPYGIEFESGLYTALIGELFTTVDFDLGTGNLTLSANAAYEYIIWEKTFPFKDACFLFGDSKTGQGVLRNTSLPDIGEEWVFDVQKIEEKFKQSGEIPAGIDTKKLSEMQGLPEDLKTALVKLNDKNNTLNTTMSDQSQDNSGLRLEGSVWMLAIVAFGSAFF